MIITRRRKRVQAKSKKRAWERLARQPTRKFTERTKGENNKSQLILGAAFFAFREGVTPMDHSGGHESVVLQLLGLFLSEN